jgi:spermidine/putrescine transport system permease protein
MGNMLLCAPLIAWIGALIVIPLAYLLYMSFQTKGPMGTVVYKFTLENYAKIFEAEYFTVLKKSVWIALISTFACVALGYPLAFFIASKRSQASGILMLMLMVPFWTCVLVTIYSFVILFAREGLLNSLLLWLGITKEPMDLLYNDFSVSVGMVYMLLPFAAMPMYASIEKLDQSLIEASKDLGAGRIRTFVKVVLPLTRPGIFAAVILTFIPCIGYYMITDMLGGGTTMLIGNIIYNQFTSARNWPFGAALSCLLAAAILIMMFAYTKTGGDLDDLGG